MSRRDEILREMGLTPVWRLRERNAAAAPVDQAPHQSGPAHDHYETGQSNRVGETPGALGADDRRAAILSMEWPALKATVASCVQCPLHARRHKTVFGVGDEQAEWVFVGEGPGAEEDLQGEPFVGQAGRLLDNMLAAIHLKRGENVYILNVVKCRPPGNRNPEPDEARQCQPFLQRQIELIRPKLLVALGRVAVVNLLGRDATIAALRGKIHQYHGIPLLVTYHPAYLLRNLPDKAKAWADLCFAVQTMQNLQKAAHAPT